MAGPFVSGGGESRTPVLQRIIHSVYVRSLPFGVSNRWPADGRRLDEPPRVSPAARRRDGGLAQICDTLEAAPGGLPRGHLLDVTRSYAARAKLLLAVGIFPS